MKTSVRWSRSAAVSRTRRGPARWVRAHGALERVVWRERRRADAPRGRWPARRLSSGSRGRLSPGGGTLAANPAQAPAIAALALLTSDRAAAQASSGVAARVDGVDQRAADDDAVGQGGDAGRLLGVEIPKPTASGASVRSRRRASSAGSSAPTCGAGAGDAGHGHAVHEGGGRGGDQVESLRRCSSASPCGTSETPAPAASAASPPASRASERSARGFVERQVGDDEGFHAGRGGAREEPLGAEGEHGVQVGEQHEGSGGAVRRGEPQDVVGRDPGGERGVGRLLHHGAVGDGVGERDAELDDVGAGIDERRDQAVAGLQVRVAAGQVGDERRASCARRRERARQPRRKPARRDGSGARSSFAPAGPAASDFVGGLSPGSSGRCGSLRTLTTAPPAPRRPRTRLCRRGRRG